MVIAPPSLVVALSPPAGLEAKGGWACGEGRTDKQREKKREAGRQSKLSPIEMTGRVLSHAVLTLNWLGSHRDPRPSRGLKMPQAHMYSMYSYRLLQAHQSPIANTYVRPSDPSLLRLSPLLLLLLLLPPYPPGPTMRSTRQTKLALVS